MFSKQKNKQLFIVALILLTSFLIRMYFSYFDGHHGDLNIFKGWSSALYNKGLFGFYKNVYSDYPPIFVYILWITNMVYKSLISSSFDNSLPIFINFIKTPAILSDVISSFIIFLIVKKYTGFRTSLILMSLYAFNPAIIYNSAIWGQVDSIYVMFILFSLLFLSYDSPIFAGVFLTLAILTKPQSLIFIPIFIYFLQKYRLITQIKVLVMSLIVFVIVSLPFSVQEVFNVFKKGYERYPYISMNAFNLWSIDGFFKNDSIILFLFDYRTWGYILFGLFVLYVASQIKTKNANSIYLITSILFFGFFIFFTRIHERYFFPVLAPLAISISFDKRLLYIYIVSTFTFFLNLHFVLKETQEWLNNNEYLILISLLNIGLLFYLLYYFKNQKSLKKEEI